MDKKTYCPPVVEIDKFLTEASVFTESGIENGGNNDWDLNAF